MGQFDDFINRYFDPGFAAPATSYGVRCWLATNQDGGAVSYVNDVLGYQPGGDAYPMPFVTGEVHQLFNDRTSEHPFDPDSADRTIITLKPMRPVDQTSLIGAPGEPVIQVEFRSITWGGRFQLRDLTCRANVLSGYGSPIGQPAGVPEALYTLSLGTPFDIV